MQRYVYRFARGQADAGSDLKHLVGGKGASLGEMTRAGLNVPPGFTISAECCELYHRANLRLPEELYRQVREAMGWLEEVSGRRFGQGEQPLLVAVRSGAAQSMPGMMDTVLNVGLHPECVRAAARTSGRAAWDAYYHFILMFGHIVGGVEECDGGISAARAMELDTAGLEQLCGRLQQAYRERTGRDFPTDPESMLFEAIEAVFRSWNTERAVAYRRHHNVTGLLGTAVTVQAMCPSEVAGVMFTANPVTGQDEIIIESSFGLGEAVVLGKVTPDRFVLRRPGLEIIERAISDKRPASTLTDSREGEAPAEPHREGKAPAEPGRFGIREGEAPAEPKAKARQEPRPPECSAGASPSQTGASPSLADVPLVELARLGLRVEDYFQTPCDIEWGLSRGQFYLMQARPIKQAAGTNPAELEKVRQEEIARLRGLTGPGGTVWARYNLAEILPEPTPLTWAIVRRFMSGQGGFGLMYRDLGFDPDPALDEMGIFDLVCGRPYCNLSREPRMQYRALPFEHSFAALKQDPARALYPQASFQPAKAPWHFWLRIPVIFFRLWWSAARLQQITRHFATTFRKEILPAFVAETEQEAERHLGSLTPPQLLERLNYWIERTLCDFARDSLKPTALAGMALGNLERGLARLIQASGGRDLASGGREPPEAPSGGSRPPLASVSAPDVRQLVGQLVMGVHPDPEADLPAALRELREGRLSRGEFLRRFGHRGSGEMELAQPRWSENPEAVDQFRSVEGLERDPAANAAGSPGEPAALAAGSLPPRAPLASLNLTAAQRAAFEAEINTLKDYLSLRETAKHALMRGYALIRRYLVELDRRCDLEGGIFYLTLEELPAVSAGHDFRAVSAERRRQRALLLQLPVPQVLFSDDLEAIGRPIEVTGSDVFQGVPLSAGVVEGTALVLDKPPAHLPEGEYILVCPSTDPAWVPLFARARGLVMETGGVLSHGAILAREFGLPAVAGLPEVHRRLRTGQRLRIDGGSGRVNVLAG